jgi:hypothetical protein
LIFLSASAAAPEHETAAGFKAGAVFTVSSRALMHVQAIFDPEPDRIEAERDHDGKNHWKGEQQHADPAAIYRRAALASPG